MVYVRIGDLIRPVCIVGDSRRPVYKVVSVFTTSIVALCVQDGDLDSSVRVLALGGVILTTSWEKV